MSLNNCLFCSCIVLTSHSVFRSPAFVFIVDEVRFTVQQEAVARHSESLKVMMQGHMKEAQDGVATLQDVDKATFVRFLEYVYTGDYNVPQPTKAAEDVPTGAKQVRSSWPEEDGGDGELEIDDPYDCQRSFGFGHGYTKSSAKKGKNVSKSLKSPSRQLAQPTTEVVIKPALPTNSITARNGTDFLSGQKLFMSHAKIYVFAHLYAINDLKTLTARRLDQALHPFKLPSTTLIRTSGIPELIRYVYNHTPDAEDGKANILRLVVSTYAANHAHPLRQSEFYVELLKEGGAFSDDLNALMCDRFPMSDAD